MWTEQPWVSQGLHLAGGIFRMSHGFTKGCFAAPLGVQISIFAELVEFIMAVELAELK